jgi:hypothetical protein
MDRQPTKVFFSVLQEDRRETSGNRFRDIYFFRNDIAHNARGGSTNDLWRAHLQDEAISDG